MKNRFYIKSFDDYHEIESKTYNTIEFGCFPDKNHLSYNRYFGLFYKGKIPNFSKIINNLKNKIEFDKEIIHYYTGENIGITLKQLEQEIKEVLKNRIKSKRSF